MHSSVALASATRSIESLDPALKPDPDLAALLRQPEAALAQMTLAVFKAYRDRPAMAWRKVQGGRLENDYTIIDYAELESRVLHTASAFRHDRALGLVPGDPVAIMAFANVDFATLNLALGLCGLPIVPLQTTAATELLAGMMQEVKPPCIATALEHLETSVTLAIGCTQTRCVIVFDHDGLDEYDQTRIAEQQARLAKERPGLQILPFSALRARGANLPQAQPYQPAPGEDPLVIVYYTSGSTGTPKGAMHNQRLVKAAWAQVRDPAPIVLNYQPLNHVFGMFYLWLTFANGGVTCFTGRSDLSTLMEDIAKVRPTTMALVPRICELIQQRFMAQHPDLPDGELDWALARFRQTALGGRMTDAVVGSAPLDPALRAFTERLLGRPIIDGYGSTESGSITLDQKVTRPPIIDYKLIDVPELGYFITDKPHPRGELCIKSQNIFAGYFGRPDLTAAAFDDEGFYRTGDIVAEVEPDRLAYLDRRNNVMKLAQGEFVAIAPLESLYSRGDPAISQVYLYGNSARAYLLGVVVPNLDALPHDLDEVAIKERLLSAIRRVGIEAGLNAYEIPRDILVELEPFSVANGLQSALAKHLRPAFRMRYGERLEAIYAAHADDQATEIDNLRRNGRDRPMEETLRRAAASVLGLDAGKIAERDSFAALGGDSLAGLSYALLLEDIYGLPIDVSTIMHPAGSFVQLKEDLTRQISGADEGVTATDVHGADQSQLRAADLQLEKFIPAAVLAAVSTIAPASETDAACVLLTGANGFLGRFLALEQLKRLSVNGGKLICIARGADDASARSRLLESFAGGDDALLRDIKRLAEGRLEVLAGDLAKPHLGLPEKIWLRLADEVDLVVHPAALVNHKLPYSQLFRPNVAGTATLIELAVTTRLKRVLHISTVAAAMNVGAPATEEVDIRDAIASWQTSEGYADGYGASKWAAEVLLREANTRLGLPVCVFRSGMIMAPKSYSGHLNIPDIFTRLILSLAVTRLAPDSFYTGEGQAHYDGLPVDFIAAAVSAIGERRRTGFHTFHVLNPHDDGISQDTFVQWLEELGYSMTRAPFTAWLARFEGAMRALPDDARRASMLPLMEALSGQQPVRTGPTLPCPQFVAATAQANITADGRVPHLERKIIARYVTDLKAEGLLRKSEA
ncbi:thioester reductase domain-containing protein [uncultured Novosphingobium sp.]|uniref:thioester reductase domain-containing protein n=1 Tax=uncultured Novosphingobium sp. TaxID=292277 RepID=UPI00258FB3F6|nr:thioester reductase domain-containing protein [uncultured Novosphingobium sp.]